MVTYPSSKTLTRACSQRAALGAALVIGLLMPTPGAGQGRMVPERPAWKHFHRGEVAFEEAMALRRDKQDERARVKYDQAIEAFVAAVDAAPDMVDAYVKIGVVYFSVGEPAEAVAHLQEGLRREPDNHDLMFWLGNNLFHAGREAEALPHLERVAAAAEGFPQVHLLLGTHYFKTGAYERAQLSLERYIQGDPDNVAARGMLGNTYFKLKRYAQALAAFEAVKQRSPDNSAVDVSIANAHYQLRHYAQTVKILTGVLEREPKRHGALFDVAQSYFQLGDFEQAIAFYGRFLELKPDNFNGRYFRGSALIEVGRDKDALVDLSEASRIKPRIPQPRYKIGLIHLRAGRLADARTALKGAEKLASADPWIKTALGSVARGLGEVDAAEQLQRAAVKLAPDQARLHGNLALTLYRKGQSVAADTELDRALSLEGDDPWLRRLAVTIWAVRAQEILASGDASGALRYVRRAMAMKPDDPQLKADLALIHIAQGDHEAALAVAQPMVTAQPDNAAAQHALGRALLLAGRPEEAEAPLAKAYAARASAEIATARGAALLLAKRIGAAIEVLDAAHDAYGSSPSLDVNRALAHLGRGLKAVVRGGAEGGRLRNDLSVATDTRSALPLADGARAHYAAWVVALRRGESGAARSHQMRIEELQPRLERSSDEPILSTSAPRGHLDYLRALTLHLQRRHGRVVGLFENLPASRAKRSPEGRLLRQAHIRLSEKAFRDQKLEAARGHLSAAAKIEASAALAHNLAVVDFMTGKAEQAEQGFRDAAEQVPEASFNLAIALEARGEHRQAFDQLKRVAAGGDPRAQLAEKMVEIRKRIFGFE